MLLESNIWNNGAAASLWMIYVVVISLVCDSYSARAGDIVHDNDLLRRSPVAIIDSFW